MPLMTIQSIVDRSASQADMDGNFVSAEEWLSWYAVEARALVTFLARNNYANGPTSFTAVDYDTGTGTIEPSTGTLALVGVFEVRDNKYRRLHQRPWQDLTLNLTGLSSRQTQNSASFYSVMQSDDDMFVILDPFPSSGTYKGVFLADPAAIDATLDDTVNWPFGFEEFIVLRLARRALIKENSDTSQIDQLIAEEERRIEEHCWQFSMRDGNLVRNVDRDQRGWTSGAWAEYPNYGPWDSWYWF